MKKKILIILGSIYSLAYNGQSSSAGGQNSLDYENNKIQTYEKDFDLDLYTGTVNIKIPLQQIKADNISLDVGLNYDATGVLVNNVSGIVGQNWFLNAGGAITRKIKGMCFDELTYVSSQGEVLSQPGIGGQMSFQKGFFYNREYLNNNGWDGAANMNGMLDMASSITGRWRMDTEPDIFYFNFFGKSGYFFMGHDGNWKVSSKDNLKIVYNESTDLVNPTEGIKFAIGSPPEVSKTYKRKSIGRITIIDDKGIQYIFGDNDVKSMEISLGSNYDTDMLWPYVMKWNLKKVLDPNGKTLFTFTYETGKSFLTNLNVESPYETSSTNTGSSNGIQGYDSFYANNGSHFFHVYRENGYFYKPSYLKKIIASDGGTIDFIYIEKDNIKYTRSGNVLLDPTYNTGERYNRPWLNEELPNIYTDEIPLTNAYKSIRYVLDEIKVNFINIPVNKFKFQYANADPRVFLYQIIKNNEEKHQFFYNYPQNLPGYLSEKTDMWGYYNGYSASAWWSGGYTFWENFEANKYSARGAVTSKMLNGSLQMIIWPTGGITDFVFEAHTFRQRISNNYSIFNGVSLLEMFPNGGGGLRIKKIISEGREREFFYNNSFDEMDNNISSGILMHQPLFFTRHKVYDIFPDTYSPTTIESGGTSSGNGIIPKSDFLSSNVTYSTVFEKNNGGYIKHTFYDYNDFPDYYPLLGLRPSYLLSKKNDHTFERGQVKSKTYFDSNQNKILEKNYYYKTLSDLKSRAINYDFFTANWNYTPLACPFPFSGVWYYPQPECPMCNSKVDPYYIYYSDRVLDSELTTEYFKNGKKIESLKLYYYQSPMDPSYSLIDKIEEYPSKYDLSKFKTTKFQYAVDFGTSDSPFTDLQEKNMVGIPLSVTKYNEEQQPIARTETIYGKNSATNNLILPISVQNVKTGYNYATDETVISKVTYDLYDAHGKVLQYTDESGIPTTIIWGYNKSQPIAKIVGATYNYVNTNTNVGYLQDASDADVDTATENIFISLLDDLQKNVAFKDFQITTFTYDPLIGVTSVNGPDGLREYYKYNAQNKLEKVMDVDGNPVEEYKYHFKN